MEPAPDLDAAAKASPLWAKYGTRLERESAAEALAKRVEATPEPEAKPTRAKKAPPAPSDPLTDFMTSRQGKALQKEIVRGRLRDAQEAALAPAA